MEILLNADEIVRQEDICDSVDDVYFALVAEEGPCKDRGEEGPESKEEVHCVPETQNKADYRKETYIFFGVLYT